MKKYSKQGQNNSVILNDDASGSQAELFVKGKHKGSKILGVRDEDNENKRHKKANLKHLKMKNQGEIGIIKDSANILYGEQQVNSNDIFDNLSSQINDDMIGPHKDFAGETFSQISSTFENQNIPLQQQQSNNDFKYPIKLSNILQYQNQNSKKNKHSKEYLNNNNNDELLDFEILNNSSSGLSSPEQNHQNQVSNKMMVPPSNNAYQVNRFPSPNLLSYQQQSVSTTTLYNSGIFDEASILRLLDKSISDQDSDGNQTSKQQRYDQAQNFKYECEDVLQMLNQISQKMKEKSKKSRMSGQISTILTEELKQLEILSTSAMEKMRQLQNIGIEIIQSNELKHLKMKQYKDNIKIKIHKQVMKFKELCKKQYKQAEHQRFKFAIAEYDQNQKIQQLEDTVNRLQDDLNVQANRNEQLNYEKKVMSQQYNKRMNDLESMLKLILKSYQQDARSVEKINKINNSFSICDHSLLLQPSLINQNSSHQQKPKQKIEIQQSVDEKENINSNSLKPPTKFKENSSLRTQLLNLKKMISEFKKVDEIYQQHQQEGGGSQFQGSNSIQNLLSNLINLKGNDSLEQQSQIVKPEGSQASVNQAFIESQSDDEESKHDNNNTSFFGNQLQDDKQYRERNHNKKVAQLLSELVKSSRNKDAMRNRSALQIQIQSQLDEVQKVLEDKLQDLSMTQQEKLIQQLLYECNNEEKLDSVRSGKDVQIEDLLEITKKTIESVASSFRAGRQIEQSRGEARKQQEGEHLSLLKILEGVSSLAQQSNQANLKGKNEIKSKGPLKSGNDQPILGQQEKNSTLEISFNHNEVIIMDGKGANHMPFLDGNGMNQEVSLIFSENDEVDQHAAKHKLKGYLRLDDKISKEDLNQKNTPAQHKIAQAENNESLQDELNFNEHSIAFIMSQRVNEDHQNSVEDDILILNNFCDNKELAQANSSQKLSNNFPDLSLIEGGNNSNHQITIQPINNFDMTGGSKVGNISLYSGSSSLEDINKAFQPIYKPQTEVMTIKIQEREIKMPKLDIKRVIQLEGRETFKNNISEQPSNLFSESQQSSPSSSVKSSMLLQKSVANPSSFLNDSNSRLPDTGMLKLKLTIGKEMTNELDKAIVLDESGSNQNSNDEDNKLDQRISIQSADEDEKDDNNGKIDLANMFGAFQDELQEPDQKQSAQQQFKFEKDIPKTHIISHLEKSNNDTLDFDDEWNDNEEVKEVGMLFSNGACTKAKPPQQNLNFARRKESQEKSIDLSANLSIFKKSQSDSQLLFNIKDIQGANDNTSIDNEAQSQNIFKNNHCPDTESHCTESIQSQNPKECQSNGPLINFSKLKTPQGSNQIKFKFGNINSGQKIRGIVAQAQPIVLQQRKQLSNLQQKLRSSSGNSRSSQTPVTNSEEVKNNNFVSKNESPSQKQLNKSDIHKVIKVFKFPEKKIKMHDLTVLHEQSSVNQLQDQSVIHKVSFLRDSKVNQTQLQGDEDQQSNQIIAKKRINSNSLMKIVKNQKKRDQNEQFSEQPKSMEEQSNQLVQNYFSAAACVNRPTVLKLKQKRSIALRKGQPNSFAIEQVKIGNEYYEDEQMQSFDIANSKFAQSKQNHNYAQQMKEFSEELEINQAVKSNRVPKLAFQISSQAQDQSMISVSPGKSHQRTSQSCTPQKKPVIVVSKQLIKINSKFNSKQNESVLSHQGEIVEKRRISISKRAFPEQRQNQSVIMKAPINEQEPFQIVKEKAVNASVLACGNDISMIDRQQVKLQGNNRTNNKIIRMVIQNKDQQKQHQVNDSAIIETKGQGNQQAKIIRNVKGSMDLDNGAKKQDTCSKQVEQSNYFSNESHNSKLQNAKINVALNGLLQDAKVNNGEKKLIKQRRKPADNDSLLQF